MAVAVGACASQPAGTGSPTAPSLSTGAQAANYSGEWIVTYHVDESIGRYAFTRLGRDFVLTLRLQQTGDRVTGAFLSDGLVADVEGRVGSDGRLTLTGNEASPIPDHGSLELLQFDASLDDARGLSGALHYQSLVPGDHAWYSTGATGPILRAARTPLAITSFAGTWTGFFNTTQCVGASFCLLDAWGNVRFELDDLNGQVSGTLLVGGYLRLQVSGRVSGDHVDLRRSDLGEGGTVVRLNRSSAGRITGTATISLGWTTEIEFISVALSPAAEQRH